MLEESIQELESRSLARIASAATAEELEAVRVDALGRKGALTQFSKDMGKLAPEDRKRAILSGYQTHLAKPFDMSELVIVIAGLVGKT